MICDSCEKDIPDDSHFCKHCGKACIPMPPVRQLSDEDYEWEQQWNSSYNRHNRGRGPYRGCR